MYNLLTQGLVFLCNLKVVNDVRMRICIEIEILWFGELVQVLFFVGWEPS
jgi:hypothetical protein